MKLAIVTLLWLAFAILLALPGIREYKALANVEDSSKSRKRRMRNIVIVLSVWALFCIAFSAYLIIYEFPNYE